MSTPGDALLRICLNQEDSAAYGTFEVRGLGDELLAQLRAQPPTAAEWPQLFAVFVVTDDRAPSEQSLPMWGSYRIEPDVLRFVPRYPLGEGHRYCARFNLGARLESYFALPQKDRPPPAVLRIYPSSSVLPENLLRFYIYFSQPMRQGQARTQVRIYELLNELDDREGTEGRDGGAGGSAKEHEIEGVFLDPLTELWDPDQTRLTLILDPGRVKSGLTAHAELGRALTPGRRYRLEVGCGFRSAWGASLCTSFSKVFTVTEAWTACLHTAHFQLIPPMVRTRAPLGLRLPLPMDHVLLSAYLRVHDANGRPVLGEVSLQEEESLWQFVPQTEWEPGCYTLEVNPGLEDLAGNNLRESFDRPVTQLVSSGRTTLPFEI